MYSQHKGLLCIKLGCREKIEHTRSMVFCAKHLEERDRRKVDILPLGDVDKEIYGTVGGVITGAVRDCQLVAVASNHAERRMNGEGQPLAVMDSILGRGNLISGA